MSKETSAAPDKSYFSKFVDSASSSATAAAATAGSIAANVHSNYKASIKAKQKKCQPAEEKKGFGRNFEDKTVRPRIDEKPSLAQSVSSAAGAVAAEGLNITSDLLRRYGIWTPGPSDECFNVVNRRGDKIVYRDEQKKVPKKN